MVDVTREVGVDRTVGAFNVDTDAEPGVDRPGPAEKGLKHVPVV